MGAEERHALFIVALLLTMRKTPEDTGGAVTCGYRICVILARSGFSGKSIPPMRSEFGLCALLCKVLHLEPLRRVEV